MDKYPVGVTVTVTIPLVDLNGDPITPTALSYTVLNEADEIIAGPTAIAGPYTTDAVIAIPPADNAVAGARTVELTITTADGTFQPYVLYLLQPRRKLVFLENTFQTLAQARLTAADIPGLSSLANADDADVIPALIEAYVRLTRFGYRIRYPDVYDDQTHIGGKDLQVTPRMWPVMTEDLFAEYPEVFVTALRRAQVTEANEILRGDPITAKRRAGLMSESVGESSQMFRSGIGPLEVGLTRPALAYLTGFIERRMTLARV